MKGKKTVKKEGGSCTKKNMPMKGKMPKKGC